MVQHSNKVRSVYFYAMNGKTSKALSQGGLALKVGSVVNKGQIIGFLGYNGYSNGPHLRVEVQQPSNDSSQFSAGVPFKVETLCNAK
jgi:murein DD-endopeptidase MepM/ murein hydrolase activator NlpD